MDIQNTIKQRYKQNNIRNAADIMEFISSMNV